MSASESHESLKWKNFSKISPGKSFSLVFSHGWNVLLVLLNQLVTPSYSTNSRTWFISKWNKVEQGYFGVGYVTYVAYFYYLSIGVNVSEANARVVIVLPYPILYNRCFIWRHRRCVLLRYLSPLKAWKRLKLRIRRRSLWFANT